MVSRPLNIGVIYGGISDQKVGMDHYLHQVLMTMKRLAPHHRYSLIDHRQQTSAFRKEFGQVIIPLPGGPFSVSRWNLLEVPKVLPQFDLVFSPGLYGPARIPSGVKGVMVVHDLVRYLYPRFFVFNPAQKLLDRWAYPAMLRNYHHLITVSESTREDLMRLFKVPGERITVTHHGADPQFRPTDDPSSCSDLLRKYGLRRPFFLFLGTLEPRKNLVTLLRSLALVKDQLPHQLVVAGQKGWKWEGIFEAVKTLGLEERVRWTGYVTDEERVLFYQAAEVLVYPSWYEGFGMPLLEAMQSGCPVIASRVSAMPEVVGQAGLLVDPSSAEEISQAMLRLVREAGLRERLREAGLERAKHFSWEDSARKTLEVFEKVAG